MCERNGRLLEVRDLVKHFPVRGGVLSRVRGYVHALNGVTFRVPTGSTFGLVGESGCGKSTLARTVVRLYEPTDGRIIFEGRDVTGLRGEALREYRRRVQLVFQDPYASLNPRMTVETIITEGMRAYGLGNRKERRARAADLLERVGLKAEHLSRYPHEFSGGQRQRIGIARALALEPKLIVADEPVSALDVSVQAQVINLLLDLQEEFRLSYLLIAHDLELVRFISDEIGVMYLGRLVETGPAVEVCREPLHPYTEALLASAPVPKPGRRVRAALGGDVPSPINPPAGCAFHTRCPLAVARCREEAPGLRPVGERRQVACHLRP